MATSRIPAAPRANGARRLFPSTVSSPIRGPLQRAWQRLGMDREIAGMKTNAGNPGDGTARVAGDCSLRVLRGASWNNYPHTLSLCQAQHGAARQPPQQHRLSCCRERCNSCSCDDNRTRRGRYHASGSGRQRLLDPLGVGRQHLRLLHLAGGGASDTPSERGMTWKCRWNTTCPPAGSLNCCRVMPAAPNAFMAARRPPSAPSSCRRRAGAGLRPARCAPASWGSPACARRSAA